MHRTIQYIRYLRKARGRHGTHSPFVYAFVENALHRKKDGETLEDVISGYFHFKAIHKKTGTKNDKKRAQTDVRDPLRNFESLHIGTIGDAREILTRVTANDVVLLTGIHENENSSDEWLAICSFGHVRLSIDLFKVGLLFFREEFKEQQHFILK